MSAIEGIVKHYKALGTPYIDVPEWGEPGAPLRIYWNPITVKEWDDIVAVGAKNDADVLIRKAMNEKGEPLFTLADKPQLMMFADQKIVQRVSSYLLGQKTPEQIEKN